MQLMLNNTAVNGAKSAQMFSANDLSKKLSFSTILNIDVVPATIKIQSSDGTIPLINAILTIVDITNTSINI